MKKTVAAISALVLLLGGASVVLIGACYAETDSEIQIVQHGNDVVLSVSPSSDSVTWDLGDGRVVTGSSVETIYKSGLYLVRAIVSPPGEVPVILQRYVAVYDPVPQPDQIINAERNVEFRYSFYNGTSPDLTVLNSTGTVVSWLTYDADKRVLAGVPHDLDHYYVFFGDKGWIIQIVDTGSRSSPVISFNAEVVEDEITASPKVLHDALTRYSWSLTDLTGQLKSSHEGKNLNITAEPGHYILRLTAVTLDGSASYSQIVSVHSDEVTETVPEEQESGIPVLSVFFGSITAILLTVSVIGRSPVIASASVLSALATILTVIQ